MGSQNDAKVRPVREVFVAVSPGVAVAGARVPSGVRAQPIGFEETLIGAQNRARGAARHAGATWGVGLEGGVEFDSEDRCWLFGVVVVVRDHREASARSASLMLPRSVAERVRRGEELGPVMDELVGEVGVKTRGGAVGHFTSGLLVRADVWRQALILALPPILKSELYVP
ncbi:inosine/xanthosine triphosphatase [Deinococcus yavapaiensis]|uniref:inosine/xanthosine triphosphatase n=1 Tax=Deinococcus yavapaiensis TaxID=309889 RepID=UPI001FE4D818|nr:inosine/xanthosine triphosphatase [Deinococcus yavapaiensis]